MQEYWQWEREECDVWIWHLNEHLKANQTLINQVPQSSESIQNRRKLDRSVKALAATQPMFFCKWTLRTSCLQPWSRCKSTHTNSHISNYLMASNICKLMSFLFSPKTRKRIKMITDGTEKMWQTEIGLKMQE